MACCSVVKVVWEGQRTYSRHMMCSETHYLILGEGTVVVVLPMPDDGTCRQYPLATQQQITCSANADVRNPDDVMHHSIDPSKDCNIPHQTTTQRRLRSLAIANAHAPRRCLAFLLGLLADTHAVARSRPLGFRRPYSKRAAQRC